jgi:hypothetical protein
MSDEFSHIFSGGPSTTEVPPPLSRVPSPFFFASPPWLDAFSLLPPRYRHDELGDEVALFGALMGPVIPGSSVADPLFSGLPSEEASEHSTDPGSPVSVNPRPRSPSPREIEGLDYTAAGQMAGHFLRSCLQALDVLDPLRVRPDVRDEISRLAGLAALWWPPPAVVAGARVGPPSEVVASGSVPSEGVWTPLDGPHSPSGGGRGETRPLFFFFFEIAKGVFCNAGV